MNETGIPLRGIDETIVPDNDWFALGCPADPDAGRAETRSLPDVYIPSGYISTKQAVSLAHRR